MTAADQPVRNVKKPLANRGRPHMTILSATSGRPKALAGRRGSAAIRGRNRKRTIKSVVEIIDQLFAKPVVVVEDGLARRETGLALIVTQLLKKELAGERRGMTVPNKYEALALRQNVSRDILLKFDSRPAQPWSGETRKPAQGDTNEKL